MVGPGAAAPMKKVSWLIPLLFGLNIVFVGCDERRGQPGTRTAPSPSAVPSTSTLRDSDLKKAVRAKLENDAQLKQANLSVNADAERNEITLSGTVRSRAASGKSDRIGKDRKTGSPSQQSNRR
jgi:BON domain